MEPMVYVHLVIAVAAALGTLAAILPVRREPFATPEFFSGFLIPELAGQLFVLYGLLAWLLDWLHGGRGRLGHVATAFDAAVLVGLAFLFVVGLLAIRTVRRDLAETPGFPLAPTSGPMAWCRWWRSLVAIPLPGRHLVVHKNVPYLDDGDRAHVLDVICQRGGVVGAPVLLYVHGGAWVLGDKREQGKPMLYEMAARGWVCVSMNYRLSPKATWPDHIVDVLAAIDWVKRHAADYGGDASFVALAGGSAGGHLCALAGLAAGDPAFQPGFEDADTQVQACIPIYGVMDMTASKEIGGRYGPGLRRILEHHVMKVRIADQPALFEAASPMHRLRSDAPPFLVLHGRNDTLVPVIVARSFVGMIRGVSDSPVAYVELPFAQHGYDTPASPRTTATLRGIAAFLEAARTEHGLTRLWAEAHLEASTPAGPVHPQALATELGSPVWLVTAWNPDGLARDEAENRAANDELAALLASRGIGQVEALGASPDGSWAEPGYCIWGIDRQEAAELGARFGQLAVYEVDQQAVSVVWCSTQRTVRLA
jgi:acetyl esterase/lipase